MRKRLGDEERELENARRERDAVRASGHGGGTGDGAVERDAVKASGGDGAVESAPGDCGDVAELDTEVRADSRKLKGACFLCITVWCCLAVGLAPCETFCTCYYTRYCMV